MWIPFLGHDNDFALHTVILCSSSCLMNEAVEASDMSHHRLQMAAQTKEAAR